MTTLDARDGDLASDVQYDGPVAGVYDAVIGAALPVEATVERCRPHVEGRRVLDIGVGTGRIALPLAEVASSVVGIDNSAAMLEELRAKPGAGVLETHVADFRAALPFAPGSFGGAVSTLGSMACVRSLEELEAALTNVATVLEPGARFAFDYYSSATYRLLAQVGTVEVENQHHPSSTAVTTRIDGSTMTVSTVVTPHDGSTPTAFDETVLLIEPDDLVALAGRVGLRLVAQEPAEDLGPFDWFVLEREGGR
ncbi:class I SAM-dependent DNA methyltransferase [Nocardioides sp. CPCC 205120]|uniref:class I SAM-dependent DNA methyltransferase n=1 Tax=Nocardioides sp. CPCC 205120 TaxID=3406462 RepID=UPI003B50EC21